MSDQLTAWPGSCCGTDHLEERMSFGQLLRLAGTVMLVIDFETGALGIREGRCQATKGPNGKPEILLANAVGGDDCSFDEYVGAGRRGFRDETQ